MELKNKLKKYFITSKSWIIDLEDCTAIPPEKTVVDTIQNWSNKNQNVSL
jgi:hypothetical protein